MSQDLENVRTETARLLGKSMDGLGAEALLVLLQDALKAEKDARLLAHGGGSTLTLNALLQQEFTLKTKVLKMKPAPIVDNR